MRSLSIFVLAFLLFNVLSGCQKSDNSPNSIALEALPAEMATGIAAGSTGTLQVVDEYGQAVPGAEILIGSAEGFPFSGNRLRVDADGRAPAPAAWENAEDVTIQAPGFVRISYLRERAGDHVYKLKHAPGVAKNLTGRTSGFGSLKTDGVLDVSLVFSALKKSDLGTLDLTRLLSADVDKQSVYGQEIEMPSNLSIPEQTESVFLVVPVTLNKPRYRLAIEGDGSSAGSSAKTVAAVAAQFNFKEMISDLQDGKSFFDLINRLKFKSYSIRSAAFISTASSTAPIPGPMSMDMPIGEVPLNSSVVVQAGSVPAGYAVVATALTDHAGDLIVTDVKRLMANESRSLRTSYAGASTWVVRTLKKYEPTRVNFSGSDYEELSSIALPANQTPVEDFLPLIPAVETRGRSLLLRPPRLPTSFLKTSTRVTLSRIEIISRDTIDLVAKTPLWDFVADGLVERIDLPALAGDPWAVKGRYRWELQYTATPAGSDRPTHLSRNSIDFLF